MRKLVAMTLSAAALTVALPARAAECDKPNALGVSRTIVVDPADHPRLGTMQYPETLPLNDHEVVLTFDDGPVPRHTGPVLDILAAECIKATYFLVGQQAQQYPELVRKVHAAGHTIGTHSQHHPMTFQRMSQEKAAREVDDGIASVAAALGDTGTVAPFFRIPGLLRQDDVEALLASRNLMTWSADFPVDDWKRRLRPADVTKRALERLEAKGRGIMLLHDTKAVTVAALPNILRALKERGYKIVHVVPAAPDRPKTATVASQWTIGRGEAKPPAAGTSENARPTPPQPAPSSSSSSVQPAQSGAIAPAVIGTGVARDKFAPPLPARLQPDASKPTAAKAVPPAASPAHVEPAPALAGRADPIADLLTRGDVPAATPVAVVHAIAQAKPGPVTTANMPKSGVP